MDEAQRRFLLELDVSLASGCPVSPLLLSESIESSDISAHGISCPNMFEFDQ